MSKSNTASKFFAVTDHYTGGRWATPVAAGAAGAGIGGAAAYATDANLIIGAAIGAGVGIVAEEAARALLVDDKQYAERRIQLLEKDAVGIAAKYF